MLCVNCAAHLYRMHFTRSKEEQELYAEKVLTNYAWAVVFVAKMRFDFDTGNVKRKVIISRKEHISTQYPMFFVDP